jgi:hypothetical protein
MKHNFDYALALARIVCTLFARLFGWN